MLPRSGSPEERRFFRAASPGTSIELFLSQFSNSAISAYVMERYHLMVLQNNVADRRVDVEDSWRHRGTVGHKQDAIDVQYKFADFALHFQILYDLEGEAALEFTKAACRIVATFLYPLIWVISASSWRCHCQCRLDARATLCVSGPSRICNSKLPKLILYIG